MKEVLELHHRILARAARPLPEEGFRFYRDDSEEETDLLSEALLEGVGALQDALDPLLPEDFDYTLLIGSEAVPARFSLHWDESPAGGSDDGTLDAARSLFDQLRLLDWEERRRVAKRNARVFEHVMRTSERILAPLPSAKQLQRAFREEAKDFIKAKRRDAGRTWVLYWEEASEAGGLKEADFADGETLREALPDLVGNGAEIVTMVAFGKPLPVERIDALKAEAMRVFGDRPIPRLDEPEGTQKVDCRCRSRITSPGCRRQEARLPPNDQGRHRASWTSNENPVEPPTLGERLRRKAV